MSDRGKPPTTITVAVDEANRNRPVQPRGPWYLAAILGPILVLFAGWLLIAGPAALGWLTSPNAELSPTMTLATKLLLLAHGCGSVIGGQQVSLMPLGLTVILILLAHPVAAFSARQAAAQRGSADDTGRIWVDGQAVVWRVSLAFSVSYAVALSAVAAVLLGTEASWRAMLGGLGIGAIAALWGSSRAVGFDPRKYWPGWAQTIPNALGLALLICLVGGAALLTTAIIQNRDQIAAIDHSLDAGLAGGILLVLLQLLYLPNLIVWGSAVTLGAGLSLGDGSLVSLAITDVGFLPAIPVLGAVGEAGLRPEPFYWWLLIGVAAGAAAGAMVAGARDKERFDVAGLVGGLAGLLAGVGLVVLASLASGGLGSNRLSWLGVQLADLIVVAPSLLGLSGLVSGVIVGLIRTPPRLFTRIKSDEGDSTSQTATQELTRSPQ